MTSCLSAAAVTLVVLQQSCSYSYELPPFSFRYMKLISLVSYHQYSTQKQF